jgi:hypothetical protein
VRVEENVLRFYLTAPSRADWPCNSLRLKPILF